MKLVKNRKLKKIKLFNKPVRHFQTEPSSEAGFGHLPVELSSDRRRSPSIHFLLERSECV